jgi:hypothetical protein
VLFTRKNGPRLAIAAALVGAIVSSPTIAAQFNFRAPVMRSAPVFRAMPVVRPTIRPMSVYRPPTVYRPTSVYRPASVVRPTVRPATSYRSTSTVRPVQSYQRPALVSRSQPRVQTVRTTPSTTRSTSSRPSTITRNMRDETRAALRGKELQTTSPTSAATRALRTQASSARPTSASQRTATTGTATPQVRRYRDARFANIGPRSPSSSTSTPSTLAKVTRSKQVVAQSSASSTASRYSLSSAGSKTQTARLSGAVSSPTIPGKTAVSTPSVVFSKAATSSPATSSLRSSSKAILARIGETGKVGEDALKALGGESQQTLKTALGPRRIDQLVDNVAHEAKVGYQWLSNSNRLQIMKDAVLKESGQIKESFWHFFKSPQTGKGGPSQPLKNLLEDNKIPFEVIE